MRSPAPLFAVVLAAAAPLGSAVAQPAAETVSVELSNFKFTPGQLRLQHGHTYRLHLVNASSGGHDFAAPEFFAASTVDPADQGKVKGGRVKLSGRQSVDITVTPGRAGTYPLSCTHFLHSSMGMTGQIVVG